MMSNHPFHDTANSKVRGLGFLVYSVVTLLISIIGTPNSSAGESSLQPVDRWTNIFSGEEVKLPIRFSGKIPDGQRISWTASIENRVITRREEVLTPDRIQESQFTIVFRLPEGEPRVVLEALVSIDAGPLGSLSKPYWIYPQDPFANESLLPSNIPLAIFDPEGETSQRLSSGKIKFTNLDRVDELHEMKSGVLVIGEGVNFREYRSLPDTLIKVAGRGVRVLCLASATGSFNIPAADRASNALLIDGIVMRKSRVIADFDKRLDFQEWVGSGDLITSGVRVNHKGDSITVQLEQSLISWPWVEVDFDNGGRLIYCGFSLIKSWGKGPAPRHIFRHVLSHAARDSVSNDSAYVSDKP